ncbi:C4-dicarboxylate ABC transporter [Trichormus azollae]|uniref:C4-dicarboxylate ABC transporter n=1 Tax=Trichormus azollae TaxID=1164 RepID=UPI0009D9EEC1
MLSFQHSFSTPLYIYFINSLLLRRAFDPIFGALLFLQWPFSLHMFVFMLPWIFCLRNFSLWQFRVRNVRSKASVKVFKGFLAHLCLNPPVH